jgi:nucleotide-binding universal stress UspA family protein
MKNILVLIHDDAGQEARLQAALDITRAVDGHLVCLDVTRYPALGGYYTIDAEAVLLEDERDREAANRTHLSERLAAEDVPWSMSEMIGELGECVAAAAGLADLIVVNRELDDSCGPDMLATASRIALKAGKPVVAVSEECRRFDVNGTAIVAWDGSLPAMAALTGAVPLLKLASAVKIVEFQGNEPGSAHEAAAYLSRYDIHAEISLVARFKEDHQDLGTLIGATCASEQASYCVMGAYGHSPMRETLLGGVTRTMLKTSKIPLVLGH